MSAGICVMNRRAVSLAADSAVTISKRGEKLVVHNSANKIFNICESKPVGLVIYASNDFMEIPFEVIINEYKLYSYENKQFPSLTDYMPDFINFLISKIKYFQFDNSEIRFIYRQLLELIDLIQKRYDYLIKKEIEKTGKEIEEDNIESFAINAVEFTKNYIDKLKEIKNFDVRNYIEKNYETEIKAVLKNNLKEFDDKKKDQIYDIFIDSLHKEYYPFYVGVSISGYGKDEIFPSSQTYKFSGIVDHQVRYSIENESKINFSRDSVIQPLAQDDVMHLFIYGTDMSYINLIGREIDKLRSKIIKDSDDAIKIKSKTKFINSINELTESIKDGLINKVREDFFTPINNSIALLPIDELALFAESMINLTSIRRKVIADNNSETVGGPIDLAIITKSDGFKWVKTKQHFMEDK